jgi:riboflavin kinase / FMN adenylyltransferase
MTETVACRESEVGPGPRAVAIGAFDGVHRGHQAVVATVRRAAARLAVPSAALTFEPTPRQWFGRDDASRLRLTPDPERVALLCDLGVEQVLVQQFDDTLRRMTPEQFVRDVLVERLQARFVGIGASHTFGSGRAGGPASMAELGRQLGFEVEIVPLITVAGTTVSSSAVRAALAEGDADLAAKLLGRPYALHGRVVRGVGAGTGLGAPTANLEVPAGKLLPAEGVYAGAAALGDNATVPAAIVVGPAPTLDILETRVEAHLLDFAGDLYGQELRVDLLRRLRAIETFSTREALMQQIGRDLAEARRVFGG